jgi:hypothetical protein
MWLAALIITDTKINQPPKPDLTHLQIVSIIGIIVLQPEVGIPFRLCYPLRNVFPTHFAS